MNKVLIKSGMQTHVGVFIDNLGSGSTDHKAAANSLYSIMQALEDRHMLVGADKLGLNKDSMAFLGYLLKAGKLHCDPAKTVSHIMTCPTRNTFFTSEPFLD